MEHISETTKRWEIPRKAHINWHQGDSVNSDNGKFYIEVWTIQNKREIEIGEAYK